MNATRAGCSFVRRRPACCRRSSASTRSEQGERQAAGVAAGARDRAAAALRRALDDRGGGGEAERQEGRGVARRPGRRPHRSVSVDNAAAQRKLALNDVVLVRVTEGKRRRRARSCACARWCRAAVVVLENKTGRVLAMSGGFSYPLSQLNRATQAMRQPGSAIKPLSYLAALGKGLQPNTLVLRRTDHAAADRRRPRPRAGLLDAEELRRRLRRHVDLAPRAGEFAQSRDRASPRRRHRKQAGSQPQPPVRSCGRGADLSRMSALLSVRARRPAGAAGRSRRVLRGDRE